jgi:phage repressor protein C with HTH and peptisase S24 domain
MTRKHNRLITDADLFAAQRLKSAWDEASKRLNITQDDVAEIMDGTQGLVSQYLNGKIALNYRALLAFCKAMELEDPRLIRDDLPEQRLAVRDSSTPTYAVVAAGEIRHGYVRLPLLSMVAAMGDGSGNSDPPEVVQFLDVADWWAQQHLPHHLERVKIISSRGDSNAPLINHGDVVFVDTSIAHFDGEGLYVFNWQGRALIKRLAPNLRTGRMQIVSANPAYPPEDISTEEIDQLHIAGRVAAWWTLRNF